MYTVEHANKDNPPTFTKFLRFRVLCGFCNFKCCNSPTLEVETTEAESKRLGLPRRFPQEGSCRCLTKTGCKHGEARPVYCQLFPLQVTKDNKLVVSHWAILHCPNDRDYAFDRVDKTTKGQEFHYNKKKPKSKGKNSFPTLKLTNQKLKERPTIVEACKHAIIELWGKDYYEKALEYALQEEPEGFGLLKTKEDEYTT